MMIEVYRLIYQVVIFLNKFVSRERAHPQLSTTLPTIQCGRHSSNTQR